jgi:hypothetical protein
VLVRALGGEREARCVVGKVRCWSVHPRDVGCVACYLPSGWGTGGCVCVCYGRLTVLSDMDDWGVVLKSSKQWWSKCCPMKKEVQLSFENIPMTEL